jgi:putative tryptophan/tyrosine transport system substrate-binding protein
MHLCEHSRRGLGWIEGRTVTIEYRWADGRTERFAEIAAEFVRLKVGVIVTVGSAVAATMQALTFRSNSRPCLNSPSI